MKAAAYFFEAGKAFCRKIFYPPCDAGGGVFFCHLLFSFAAVPSGPEDDDIVKGVAGLVVLADVSFYGADFISTVC